MESTKKNINFNTAFFMRKEDRDPQWILIDAEGQILGRLATKIADILSGKHKAVYTPHTDTGDYVVIINAEKIALSGDKMKQKEYPFYSGWIGGLKIKTAEEIIAKQPEQLIELAVRRMLPKSKMGRAMLKKLKIYAGAEHPHVAQVHTSQEAAKAA